MYQLYIMYLYYKLQINISYIRITMHRIKNPYWRTGRYKKYIDIFQTHLIGNENEHVTHGYY